MLGSGMTIKFFALFFWQGLGLEPVAVNAVYVAGPLGIAVSALLAQKLSLCIGRIQTCLLCRGIGIGLLVAIAYVQSAAIVLPLYLLRTWLMNCTAGLTKSVLNDYVAKAHRGKWNSLESINLFGGSGSAALGGWVIDVSISARSDPQGARRRRLHRAARLPRPRRERRGSPPRRHAARAAASTNAELLLQPRRRLRAATQSDGLHADRARAALAVRPDADAAHDGERERGAAGAAADARRRLGVAVSPHTK